MLYKTSLDTYSSYVETGIDIETGKVRRFFPISIKKENKINNLVFFSCGNMRCKDNAVLIKAEDASGNVVTYKKRIRTIINKTWNKSYINIDLNFFKNKYNEIYSTNLKSINTTHFLELNSKLRKANNLLIYNQTKKVTRDLLFNSFFSQMKDSKVFSRYSDFREYVEAENEKSLMSVYHWGYDLSSIKNALVYASSPGLITYVDQEGLGIYGKTIIINHGAGFYSIYSHLSEINVEENQKVDKTSVIAKSGETGLAFGDHLHYGTYLQGIPFDSNEMWDKKYIKQKVITIYNNFFKEDVK
ncbi:M23 family metallopeptidase [bacterium]|nr:M23 family metallopeptidase [bacterium]